MEQQTVLNLTKKWYAFFSGKRDDVERRHWTLIVRPQSGLHLECVDVSAHRFKACIPEMKLLECK
jgi:hypothetical protein